MENNGRASEFNLWKEENDLYDHCNIMLFNDNIYK